MLLYCNITIESIHCFVVLSWLSALFCWYRNDNLRIDRVQGGEELFHEQTPLLLNNIQVQYVQYVY